MAEVGIDEILRRANAQLRQGQLEAARALYRRALAAAPRHPDALNNAGMVAYQLGNTAEALRLLNAAVFARPDFFEALNNLAIVLQAEGRRPAAVDAYRRALAVNPRLAEAHYNLGNLLLEGGQFDEALAAYEHAASLRPEAPEVHRQCGLALQAAGRLDEAAARLARAIALAPDDAPAHYSLGNVLQAAGRYAEAVVAYDEALRLDPALAERVFDLGKPRHVHVNLQRGRPDVALAACQAFMAGHPGHSAALALEAVALAELGRAAEAAALLGFDRFIARRPIQAPKGFASLRAFNQALERHIRGHPSLAPAPPSFSVEGGLSTGELLTLPKGPMAPFEKLIRDALAAYRAALPAGSEHPFVRRAPARWQATVWAIVIGRGGHQVPHIHPSGWLSAVYYVALPPSIAPPGGDDAGWIEFGRPYRDVPTTVPPPTLRIRPEEGLMILFPSYVWHGTLPFPGDAERISISFDILPRDGPR